MSDKKERRSKALKKAKRKKAVLISAGTVFAAVVVVLIVLTVVFRSDERVYSDGDQTITLREDGTYSAQLMHTNKAGTYTESRSDGVITITFDDAGSLVNARVVDNVLTLPYQWDDQHGHNMQLRLR